MVDRRFHRLMARPIIPMVCIVITNSIFIIIYIYYIVASIVLRHLLCRCLICFLYLYCECISTFSQCLTSTGRHLLCRCVFFSQHLTSNGRHLLHRCIVCFAVCTQLWYIYLHYCIYLLYCCIYCFKTSIM